MKEFRSILRSVNRYYEDFEHAVISYIKMPGNEDKQKLIEEYIHKHPLADTSDVLSYMMTETGFYDVYKEYNPMSQSRVADVM